MKSKIGNGITFGLAVAVFLAASAAQAKTIKGTFSNSGESIGIFSDFSFNGSTTSTAELNTFWQTDSLGDTGPGQGVSQETVDASSPCSFKGLSGATENGVTLTLVSSVTAGHSISGPLQGDAYSVSKTGTGCINLANGDFAGTGTDVIIGLTGANKGGTGTSTYTFVGVTLAEPGTPGYGVFQWFKTKGSFVEVVP